MPSPTGARPATSSPLAAPMAAAWIWGSPRPTGCARSATASIRACWSNGTSRRWCSLIWPRSYAPATLQRPTFAYLQECRKWRLVGPSLPTGRDPGRGVSASFDTGCVTFWFSGLCDGVGQSAHRRLQTSVRVAAAEELGEAGGGVASVASRHRSVDGVLGCLGDGRGDPGLLQPPPGSAATATPGTALVVPAPPQPDGRSCSPAWSPSAATWGKRYGSHLRPSYVGSVVNGRRLIESLPLTS